MFLKQFRPNWGFVKQNGLIYDRNRINSKLAMAPFPKTMMSLSDG